MPISDFPRSGRPSRERTRPASRERCHQHGATGSGRDRQPTRLPVLLTTLLLILLSSRAVFAEPLVVAARELSDHSENLVPVESRWNGLLVCHGDRGMAEWTLAVPQAGPYYVHFYYASGQRRPLRLEVNRVLQADPILADATGGFYSGDLTWHTAGPFDFQQGTNSLRVTTDRLMPHLAGLVISRSADNPRQDAFADLFPRPADLVGPIDKDTTATLRRLRQLLPGVDALLFVRRYTFQSSHYYTDFIDGCRDFGGSLSLLSLQDGRVTDLAPELAHGIFGRCDLSFDGQRVVFGWKAELGSGFRIWEVGIDGSGLRQLTFPPEDEPERMARYQLNSCQVYPHHTDDMHPCYLPDGRIAFVSSRCEYGILCDGPDKLTTTVLYRMEGDGSRIEKLSNNSVSESSPTVMNDGRILYTRWEYVDNGSVTNKGLWAVRPDGTGSEEIYGMSIAFPPVFNVGRPFPDSHHRFLAIGAPHMPLGVGTLMEINSRADRRTGDGVRYLTPEVDVQHQWGWDNLPGGATVPLPPEQQAGRDGRGNTSRGPLYMDPFPISAQHFLVALNPRSPWNQRDAYGLYLLDRDGGKSLIYQDDEYSSWMPIPVRPRAVPRIASGAIDDELANQKLARLIVSDVYRGLDGVPRGTVKYLRINEHVPRPWAARRSWSGDVYDQQHSVITRNSHLGLKIQHGIVPVEPDGSAHFLVRADANIFLQALDEQYMEVQRERTFVNYRPGEVRACVGCHERPHELNVAHMTDLPSALRREPCQPGPQPGELSGARPLAYEVDVQPVWDRHCLDCHGGEKTEGDLDLSGQQTALFSRSYEQLLSRGLISLIGENHPKAGNNHYLPPYSLGAHASRLTEYLDEEHYGVQLSPAERIRVTTWIDSNGQFHGSYYGRKNLRFAEHPNFRPILTFEQSRANTPPLPEEQR